MKPGLRDVLGAMLLLARAPVGCSGTTAEQHSAAADSLQGQGRFEEAIVRYGEAIDLSPKLAIAYLGRAAAYNTLGRFRQSQELLDQAIELDSNLPEAFNSRGLLALKTSQREKAIKELDEAIRLDPRFGLAYANRARVYPLTQQDDLAQWDFDRTVEYGLDPGSLEEDINGLKQIR